MSASSASPYLHPVAAVSGSQLKVDLVNSVTLATSSTLTPILTQSPLPIGTYLVQYSVEIQAANATTAVDELFAFIAAEEPDGAGGYNTIPIANETIVNNLVATQTQSYYRTITSTYISTGLNYITGQVYTGTLSGTTPSFTLDSLGDNFLVFTKIA
jgi:hypothetical protein